MKHRSRAKEQPLELPYSIRKDKYTSIPSPHIQELIAARAPRERVDAVIFLYDCINGTRGNGMCGALEYHGKKNNYPDDYLKLLKEDQVKYADRIIQFEKDKKWHERENRRVEREEERERRREELLEKDFLNAVRKFGSRIVK